MRLLQVISVVFLLLVPSHPLAAQGHRHHAQVAPNAPGLEEYLKLWGLERNYVFPAPERKPDVEGPFSLPPVAPYDATTEPRDRKPAVKPKAAEEKRFSYWGYRHHEAHAKGLVKRLHRLTNSKCCDGEESGECRISIVDMPTKRVLVDGEWCPYFDTTHIVILDGLEKMRDGQEAVALVCAAPTNRVEGSERRKCAGVYCVGLDGTRM